MPSWRQLRLWCHILSVLTHTPVQATCPAWSHFRRPYIWLFPQKMGRTGSFSEAWHSISESSLHTWEIQSSPALDCGFPAGSFIPQGRNDRKVLELPSLEERRGKMENFPRKDGVGNKEIVLPEKLWGWCYPQASEDALWVSSANDCRTEPSNSILQMLRTGTGVGENKC